MLIRKLLVAIKIQPTPVHRNGDLDEILLYSLTIHEIILTKIEITWFSPVANDGSLGLSERRNITIPTFLTQNGWGEHEQTQ